MKIFILADMEGVTGVVTYDKQARPGTFFYEEARESFMSDLSSAIEGAVAGGAKDIVIYDMHYWGLNIMVDRLPPVAKAILGKPKVVAPANGLDGTFAGLMMIGFHAKAETPGGLLTHTYNLEIKDLTINGLSVGEIGMEMALGGEMGVPAIFVSGDSKAVEEAKTFTGNIEAVSVKEPIMNFSAVCLPIEVTKKLIKEGAKRAVQGISSFQPLRIDYPVTLEIEYYDEGKVEEKLKIRGAKAISNNRVTTKADTLREAWLRFKPD